MSFAEKMRKEPQHIQMGIAEILSGTQSAGDPFEVLKVAAEKLYQARRSRAEGQVKQHDLPPAMSQLFTQAFENCEQLEGTLDGILKQQGPGLIMQLLSRLLRDSKQGAVQEDRPSDESLLNLAATIGLLEATLRLYYGPLNTVSEESLQELEESCREHLDRKKPSES